MEATEAAERGGRDAVVDLPPAPRLPQALQTLAFLVRPLEFAEWCRQRFGDTFRFRIRGTGDGVVVVSDPTSLKRLFGADRVNTIAPGRSIALEPLLGQRSVLLLTGDEHMRRRRLMLPPFHGARMRAYEATIERATESELESWPIGRRFPLYPRMQAITLDVILEAVFGVSEGRREELRRTIVEILATGGSSRVVGLMLRRLGWTPRYQRFRDLLDRIDALLLAEIADRRADPALAERGDILSILIAARFEDGSAMDDGDLRDQLMTLLLAGHETTATSLAWAFELLFRSPSEHERARVAARTGDNAHLDAVATEVLRLRPVIWFVGRKLLQPTELDGYEVPEGTVVGASIWLAHTREASFPDPHAFMPERFANGGPDTYAWIPFGGGTRRCLGAAFAQMEMRVVLRTLLRAAVLEPATDRPERITRRNITLSPARGTPALLRERARS